MDLTQEYLDKKLTELATKKDLEKLATKKDVKETLRITILMNRSLQSFKQDTLLRFDRIDKQFELNTKEHKELKHKELKELILRGDHTLVKLLVQ